MVVSCPHCQTTYNLPDDKAKSGAKLRCTVCKNVFQLNEEKKEENLPEDSFEEKEVKKKSSKKNANDKKNAQEKSLDSESGEEGIAGTSLELDGFGGSKKKNKKKGKGLIVLIILLLFVAAGAGVWIFTPFLYPVKNYIGIYIFPKTQVETQVTEALPDRVSLIELRNVRQYNVNNDKIGKIAVIEGKVVNGFNTPRELIKVEASLYDKDGKALVNKTQLAGTSISLFQLQVLGEQELEQALSNKLDIVANNSNVPPQGMVPFMVVFYNPPAEAMEFGVKVVDAKPITQ